MTAGKPARPLGVTILAVLAAIVGAFMLIGGLAAVGLSGSPRVTAGQPAVGTFLALLGLLTLALGVLYLAFAIGAWRLRPWAWGLGMLVAVIGIVVVVIDIAAGSRDTVRAVIDVAMSAAILYYLTRPQTRQAFGRPATA